MCIGLKIRKLCEKKNLPPTELARYLGKSKQAVYEMLDKQDLNTSILRQVAAYFNVPISYFFDEPQQPTITQTIERGDNNTQTAGVADDLLLREKISNLEKLLAEKERLISVLMEKK